jgi:hypothetical protein
LRAGPPLLGACGKSSDGGEREKQRIMCHICIFIFCMVVVPRSFLSHEAHYALPQPFSIRCNPTVHPVSQTAWACLSSVILDIG